LFSLPSFGQYVSDSLYRPPVAEPLAISGNFDEIRPNAFHAGIDFKTSTLVGLNVCAVQDGYVSRIKVDLNGFGRALYIDHPNGTTSVYGHLEVFIGEVGRYCLTEQYRQKRFAVDINLKPGEIIIKKGDVIALAGNRGGSSGPHLHFEVRTTKTQNTLNVFKHTNLTVPDTTPPVIEKLWLYPLDVESTVEGKSYPVSYPIVTTDGLSTVASPNPLKVTGNIGFGIQTYDLTSNSLNKVGVYSIEMFDNDSLIFKQLIDSLSFDYMRYVNSVIDYGYYQKTGTRINKLFVQPNNKLKIYPYLEQRGILSFTDTCMKKMQILVTDDFSNTNALAFYVKSTGEIPTLPKKMKTGRVMHYQTDNYFKTEKIKLLIPKDALYDSLVFEYSVHPRKAGFYSELHQVHNIYTALQKSCKLSVKPVGLPSRLINKALLVSLDPAGKVNWSGGEFKDGFVTANIWRLGTYAVSVDTVAPQVQPLFSVSNFTDWTRIAFSAKDDLSGINSYSGKIDDQWTLFEYDPKQDLLYYKFDPEHMQYGKTHKLELVVLDAKGNKTVYTNEFYK
jgi:Membrane proteins related to metalloendopeptidases